MRTIVFLIKFLLLAAFFIISNQNLALIEQDNRQVFFDEYTGWFVSVGKEIGTLTGYVVKVEWLPREGEHVGRNDLEDLNAVSDTRHTKVRR